MREVMGGERLQYLTFEFEYLIIEHCVKDDLACRVSEKNRKNSNEQWRGRGMKIEASSLNRRSGEGTRTRKNINKVS